MKPKGKLKLSPGQLILLSFLAVIGVGTALLMCPVSSADGTATGFIDSVFTATSAACVTGLAVVDTAAHWSGFGKAVILLLIQVGGLGAMTIITGLVSILRKRSSLGDTKLLMQAAGNDSLAGITKLVRRLLLGTVIFELLGAALLSVRFVPIFGWGRGIWYGVFHSVSAFCNAGFDIFGDFRGGASLSAFAGDPLVVLTVSALIVIGGLGFIVWSDLLSCRFRFKALKFHSKIVLVTTLILIALPTGLFLLFESSHAFAGTGAGERLLLALFQAVTPRTAGFATVQMAELSDAGVLLTVVLMLTGGSPGSTAGGMKTTTVAVLFLSALASVRRAEPTAFKRRIDGATVRQALSILVIYVAATLSGTAALCAVESLTLRDSLFEVSSAIATVGLSTGVTPTLGAVGKIILTLFMFAGRIGGLTIAVTLTGEQNPSAVRHPVGRIIVG